MNARSARRILVAAFALSLLLHLILAVNLRAHREASPSEVEVVQIEHRSLVMHVAKTPPPVRPKKTPSPQATTLPKSSAKPERQAGSGGGPGKATPPPPPSPAPVVTATAVANACGRNDTDAAVVATPQPADIPAAARAEGTSGTTVVNVQLDAQGAILGATVSQSSGNSSLDLVAVGMARSAQYAPALKDCKAVASVYAFSVKFVAW